MVEKTNGYHLVFWLIFLDSHQKASFSLSYTVGCRDLNTELGLMPNDPVFECHLNTEQMDPILFSYVLVQNSNGWSSTSNMHRKMIIWIPNHLKSKLQKVQYSNGRYSDPHCITTVNVKILRTLTQLNKRKQSNRLKVRHTSVKIK